MSEIIIYPSDQSANRTAIEANIGETYGITGIPAYDNTVDGFVETWYDQSGNGRDATQSVAASQPKIVDAGSLVSGGIDFDGVNDFFTMNESTNPFDSDGDMSAFIYCDYSTTTIGGAAFAFKFGPSTVGSRFGRSFSANISIRFFDDNGPNSAAVATASAPTGDNLFSFVLDRSANLSFYQNGALVGTADATVLTGDIDVSPKIIGAGSNTPSANYGAPITEIIIYPSDQSANRTAIEGNINDHYNIY